MAVKQRGALLLTLIMVLIAGFTTGCGNNPSTGVVHAPLPEAAPAPAPQASPAASSTTIKIFFATDRQQTGKDDPNVYFGSLEGESLTYGTVSVSIPASHSRGIIERPKWYRLEFSEDQSEHIVLLKLITEKDAPSFFKKLHNDIDKTEQKEVFVFIHGFNNSFQEAAFRTAQIANDIGFLGEGSAGVPIMYSWPSTEKKPPLGYTQDKTRMSHARPHLVKFITELARTTGAKRINIIAHSMGADLLGLVLAEIAQMKDKPIFNQIILASPDIDQKDFKQYIAPRMIGMSTRTTVYTSSCDIALEASYLTNGARRVGDSTDGTIVVKGVETIDASKVDFGLIGHSYFADARPLLDDMFTLVTQGLPASKRNLPDAISSAGLKYWMIAK